jgi:hypothetical protein
MNTSILEHMFCLALLLTCTLSDHILSSVLLFSFTGSCIVCVHWNLHMVLRMQVQQHVSVSQFHFN